MDNTQFNLAVKNAIARSEKVLISKNEGYNPPGGDRLHNFKVAAKLQGISLLAAIAGMRAKHTTSVYDMCHSGKEYSPEEWQEKLGDDLNYILLTFAALDEMRNTEIVLGEVIKKENPLDAPIAG